MTEKDPGNALPVRDIRSFLPEELAQVCAEAGEKPYRAGQLFDWLHGKEAASYEEMLNLPKRFREYLEDHFPFPFRLSEQGSSPGSTGPSSSCSNIRTARSSRAC